jgi:hypothetical protein
MDREGVALLGRSLVHVDDLRTDAVLMQKQGRGETDRTGADNEDLGINVAKHRESPRPHRAQQTFQSRAPRMPC